MISNSVQPSSTLSLICFNIITIQLCLELNYIEKGILLPAITPIPQTPDYFIGLINREGESVPVIDLALSVGLERKVPYSLNMPILLCKSGTKTLGLIVDNILKLETVSKDNLQLQDDFNNANSFFKANILIDNEISLLLDINKIFAMTVLIEPSFLVTS